MFTTLANSYGAAKVSRNADGSYSEQVYTPLTQRSFKDTNPDIIEQQNGVPRWIQRALGINASTMSPEDLAKLNTDYSINRTRQDRNVNRVLTDKSGKVLGTNTYYDAPFSVLNDVVLPAAMVWGGGYLGANALFGGGLGGAAAGGATGASGASGATNAALIDSAAGTAGYGASSAGAGGAAAGGLAGTGIPDFAQLPGYGNNVATLADASGASPFTASGGADPVTSYLTSGASEGSTLGNALTGAGGAAGAVGSGTTAGNLAAVGNFLGGNVNMLNLGGNLLNSYLGYRASNNAANAQINASREANALNKAMFDQIRADNMPALQARNTGLSGYQNLLKNPGQIVNDPGYKFGLQQGQAAYDNSGAARGMRLSGGQAKALTKFGQDYGQTKFDQSLNRFGNLAGLGGTGAQTIAGAGQNYANNAGQNITGAGNAAASGYIGGANAVAGGVNNFLRNWQETNLLRQLGIGG